MTEPRFYAVDGGYHFHVMDRSCNPPNKAAKLVSGVLYPADDFGTKGSAERYAGRLNRMVETAAAKGATREEQDQYMHYL